MMGRLKGLLAAVTCIMFSTSCASLNIDAIPMPGKAYQDGYDIVVEFANVLNLPDRAKVVMDGTTVGVVSKAVSNGDRVDVTARIDPTVKVPSNVHAVLEQATVLGDIYLALTYDASDASAAQSLAGGARVPLSRTTSPPQLEDTLASLANFVGSGSIQRAQNSILKINRVTPPRTEVRSIVARVTTDLRDLSDHVDTVDQLLTGLNQTSTVFANRTPELSLWFSPRGVDGFRRDMVLANTFGRLLPSLGSIYNGGYWLVPLIHSLGSAFEAVQGTKQAVEAEYPLYRRFIKEYFMPQDKYPAINITSIIGPDGRELSGNVEQVLRMLGAVP